MSVANELGEIVREQRETALKEKVLKLFYDSGDDSLRMYFDPDSDKNLAKKYEVLKKLAGGQDVPDNELLEILENVPKDDDGNPMVADWR